MVSRATFSFPAGHCFSNVKRHFRHNTRLALFNGVRAGQSVDHEPENQLPPELQDLCISEDGQFLIDTKTGKTVNEFGATRFDVAVRAIRGEFDPPEWQQNTERNSGLLLDSLTQWPAVYEFQLVVKQTDAVASSTSGSDSSGEGQCSSLDAQALLEDFRSMVAEVSGADIRPESCIAKPRLNGKYVSMTIPARVPAAHVVQLVFDQLAKDPRVIMKY